jgi:hypothetical protein
MTTDSASRSTFSRPGVSTDPWGGLGATVGLDFSLEPPQAAENRTATAMTAG